MNLKKLLKNKKNICKGCFIYQIMCDQESGGVDACRLPQKINGHPCPCSYCLVKGVCDSTCKLLDEYLKTPIVGDRLRNARLMGKKWWARTPSK